MRAGQKPGSAQATLRLRFALYEEGLRIRRTLATTHVEHRRVRMGLVVSYWKIARTTTNLGRRRQLLLEGLAVANRLSLNGALSSEQKQWPELIQQELARVAALAQPRRVAAEGESDPGAR